MMKHYFARYKFNLADFAAVSTWAAIYIITLIMMFERAMSITDISLVSVLFLVYLSCFLLLAHLRATDLSELTRRVLLVVMLAMTYLLVLFIPAGYLSILTIIWVAVLVSFVSIRTCLIISTLVVISWFMLFSWKWQMDGVLFSAILFGSFHLFAILMAHQTEEAQKAKEQMERVNQELRATQELVKQVSKQQERTRIARDLHDLVGHHLTALIINLEVAKHQTEGPAKQQIEQSHALAKLLLSDVREAINQIRVNNSIDINALVDLWRSYIPTMTITTSIDESISWQDLSVTQTLSFCILEALTNSMRHANASKLHIQIAPDEERIITTVSDNGQVKGPLVFGNGLNGMLARLTTISGSLKTAIKDGHLELVIDVPREVPHDH